MGDCTTFLKAPSSLSVRAVLREALGPGSCVDCCRRQCPVPGDPHGQFPKSPSEPATCLWNSHPSQRLCQDCVLQHSCTIGLPGVPCECVQMPCCPSACAVGVAIALEQKWQHPCLHARSHIQVGEIGPVYQESTEETRTEGGCWAVGGVCGAERVSLL